MESKSSVRGGFTAGDVFCVASVPADLRAVLRGRRGVESDTAAVFAFTLYEMSLRLSIVYVSGIVGGFECRDLVKAAIQLVLIFMFGCGRTDKN